MGELKNKCVQDVIDSSNRSDISFLFKKEYGKRFLIFYGRFLGSVTRGDRLGHECKHLSNPHHSDCRIRLGFVSAEANITTYLTSNFNVLFIALFTRILEIMIFHFFSIFFLFSARHIYTNETEWEEKSRIAGIVSCRRSLYLQFMCLIVSV